MSVRLEVQAKGEIKATDPSVEGAGKISSGLIIEEGI